MKLLSYAMCIHTSCTCMSFELHVRVNVQWRNDTFTNNDPLSNGPHGTNISEKLTKYSCFTKKKAPTCTNVGCKTSAPLYSGLRVIIGPIYPTYQSSPPLSAFLWQDVPEGRQWIITKQFHFWCTSLPSDPRAILTLDVLIICMHISVTRLCIMGYLSNELWDLWDESIGPTHNES